MVHPQLVIELEHSAAFATPGATTINTIAAMAKRQTLSLIGVLLSRWNFECSLVRLLAFFVFGLPQWGINNLVFLNDRSAGAANANGSASLMHLIVA